MASNYTTNYNLCQWQPTDQVQRTDFNADNAKLDAALAVRNCQAYMISYVGDDSSTRTITFPYKPVLVIVLGGGSIMVAIRGFAEANLISSVNIHRTPDVAWGENSFTWDIGSDYPVYGVNSKGATYQMFALLEVE